MGISSGNEGMLDKILSTILPNRSTKFIQTSPEEIEERKNDLRIFMKIHNEFMKSVPNEFKNTFREYPHKKDGIEGYINNKVMNSCVLFHLDGPHKLFEKYIPTYRKKLNMYLNKKTKGKYIAKVDDLSDADATGYNLGVFVIMVKKKKDIATEGFLDIFKNKRKEKLKAILKKYKNQINISFNYYKEARDKLKDVLNKNNQFYNLEMYESVSKQDFFDFYTDSIYDIFEDNTNDTFIYSGDDGYIRVMDDESKLKKVIGKVLNELRSLDNKKYEFRYPQGHEIIEIWVNHNLSKQDLKNIYNEVYGDKANESLYNKSLFQYEYLLTYDFDSVALESFGSELLRIITGILDTVLKLLNNFKATVLGVFKDLKRTELQEFEDSNKTTLPRILKYPYEFLAQQNVVVPRGMVKPYKVTTEKIKGCLDVLDMVNRSEKALASVDNVLNMLMSNTKFQVKQDTINVGELRSLEHIFKDENNCFSTFKRCEEQQFSKVFQSDHCLVDTYHLLSNTVIYEQDVSKVYSTLERIYQKFEQILRLVESKQVNLTKSDIITLAGQTTTLAKLFDMYGTVITDLQRVEHNFVLVLSSIAEKHGL